MNLFFVKIKKLTKTWILCLRTIFYSNNSVRKPLRKYHLGHGPKAHYLRQKNEEMKRRKRKKERKKEKGRKLAKNLIFVTNIIFKGLFLLQIEDRTECFQK